jgi:hypothetical protein
MSTAERRSIVILELEDEEVYALRDALDEMEPEDGPLADILEALLNLDVPEVTQ